MNNISSISWFELIIIKPNIEFMKGVFFNVKNSFLLCKEILVIQIDLYSKVHNERIDFLLKSALLKR